MNSQAIFFGLFAIAFLMYAVSQLVVLIVDIQSERKRQKRVR
jgi:hypothetical protein